MKNQDEAAQTKLQEVDVETGEIELPTIDITKHIGKRVKIVKVGTFKGKFGYVAKVETDTVETIKGKDKPILLRGSKIFGLQVDSDGNIGWGAKTKLGLFMSKMKAASLKQLIGKEVILQSITTDDGADYLTFN